MAEFKVIEGRMSENYNYFNDYDLVSCSATDTRLMGVVAMKMCWKSRYDIGHLFQQVIHLDYSEYGIDEYFEYRLDPSDDYFSEDLTEAEVAWSDISKDLGGKKVDIEPAVMIRLIDDAIEVAENNILKREDRFKEFRYSSILSCKWMKESLCERGFINCEVDTATAISIVSPEKLSDYETINYFLMRLVDRDFPAAASLSELDIEELKDQLITRPGIQSLIKNSIGNAENPESAGKCYACESVTLSNRNYHLSTSVVELSGEPGSSSRKVKDFRTGFIKTLSDFEVAGSVSIPEYLTVYDIPDEVLDSFDFVNIEAFRNSTPKIQSNGWLLPIYNKDNSHVDKSIFRISGDIKVCALVSIPGELVVMSNKLIEVSIAEQSIAESEYGEKLVLKGRYHIATSIFQTLCETTGAMLSDLVSYKNPIEPIE